jgi:hypothetical protein
MYLLQFIKIFLEDIFLLLKLELKELGRLSQEGAVLSCVKELQNQLPVFTVCLAAFFLYVRPGMSSHLF